jgi:hypothetical protein
MNWYTTDNNHNYDVINATQGAGVEVNGNLAHDVVAVNVTQELRKVLLSRGVLEQVPSISHAEDVRRNNRTEPPVLAIPIQLLNTTGSLGVLTLRRQENGTKWSAARCTMDARWAAGRSVIESSGVRNRLSHEFTKDRVRNLVQTELDVAGADDMTFNRFVPPNDGSLSSIHIDGSWFDALAPVIPPALIPGNAGTRTAANRTTLETLLELTLLPESTVLRTPSARIRRRSTGR